MLGLAGGFLHFLDNWAQLGALVFGILLSLLMLPGMSFGRCACIFRGIISFVAFPVASIVFMLTTVVFYQMTNVDEVWCPLCYRLNCINFTGWCER
jgi:predicted membrane-bound spermidine synthase